MRVIRCLMTLALLCALAACSAPRIFSRSEAPPSSVEQLASRASEALWAVVPQAPPSRQDIRTSMIRGSAVAVSEQRVLAACSDVINPDRIGLVRLEAYAVGEIKATDGRGGLCVLDAEGADLKPPLAYRPFEDLVIGETIYAMTNDSTNEFAITETVLLAKHWSDGRRLELSLPMTEDALTTALFDGEGNLVGLAPIARAGEDRTLAAPVDAFLTPDLAAADATGRWGFAALEPAAGSSSGPQRYRLSNTRDDRRSRESGRRSSPEDTEAPADTPDTDVASRNDDGDGSNRTSDGDREGAAGSGGDSEASSGGETASAGGTTATEGSRETRARDGSDRGEGDQSDDDADGTGPSNDDSGSQSDSGSEDGGSSESDNGSDRGSDRDSDSDRDSGSRSSSGNGGGSDDGGSDRDSSSGRGSGSNGNDTSEDSSGNGGGSDDGGNEGGRGSGSDNDSDSGGRDSDRGSARDNDRDRERDRDDDDDDDDGGDDDGDDDDDD